MELPKVLCNILGTLFKTFMNWFFLEIEKLIVATVVLWNVQIWFSTVGKGGSRGLRLRRSLP